MMMASAGPQKRLTTEQYMVLQEALVISSARSAADHLGVLARLDAGPADSITIARDCAISERGVRLLLAALCSLGVIEKDAGDVYRTALPDLAQMTMWITPWSQLTQAIRDDQPARAGDTPGGAETLYPEVVAHLGAWFAPAAERAAGHLIARGQRVLDLGAGAAPWSLALAARNPDMHVTAVDVPAVLAVTRQVVATSGYADRFGYLSGDLFTIDLGRSAYDLAIAGNLCHLFDEATNRRLLRRLFDALRPGARWRFWMPCPTSGSMAHGRSSSTRSACCCARIAARSTRSRRTWAGSEMSATRRSSALIYPQHHRSV